MSRSTKFERMAARIRELENQLRIQKQVRLADLTENVNKMAVENAERYRLQAEEAEAEAKELRELVKACHVVEENLKKKIIELQKDRDRLDFLDTMNKKLNDFYKTNYGWCLILSPNVVRLLSEASGEQGYCGAIDLNDSCGGHDKHRSCRDAIDFQIKEKQRLENF